MLLMGEFKQTTGCQQADIHALFDPGLIGINQNYEVVVVSSLNGTAGVLTYNLAKSSAFLALYSSSVSMPLSFKLANFSIASKISAS